MPRYDHNELRRCLTFAFSPSELDELARSVGVFPPPRGADPQRGTDETARLLVRMLSNRGELDELVERLRREQPLVEWPQPIASEPAAPPEEPTAAEAIRSVPASAPEPGRAAEGLTPEPVAAPPISSKPSTSAATEARDDSGDSHGLDAQEGGEPESPAEQPLPPAGWLGTDTAEGDEQAAARRTKLRWLALAGAGVIAVLAAVIGGFAAGRASSPGEGEASRAAATEPATLAQPAAAELRRAMRAVAQACALPDARGPAQQVLARAFKSCAARGRDQGSPLGTPTPEPGADAPSTGTPRETRAERRPPEPAPRGSGCLQRCDQLHERCKTNECGPEPTKGSEYTDYQRCLSRCLRKASQCRLRCG